MLSSKEALEQLNIFISREKHINSEKNKIVNDCVDIIKQDLERLEALEKENKKLKKALEILKRFNFSINETRHNNSGFEIWTDSLLEAQELTQQEYEFLKEVLGDD